MNDLLGGILIGLFTGTTFGVGITALVVSRSVHEERHPLPPVVPPVRPVGGDAHNYREQS